MKRLLIAGCGDIGIRLAARLGEDWQVHGLRRQIEALPRSIRPLRADLADPTSLVAARGDWDAVVYQATPDDYTEAGYRAACLHGLTNLFGQARARRLIFVSSTAVFGQDAGEWVDETSATEPKRFNGQILLQAEALAAQAAAESIVVRFSGIYGPGRDRLVRQLRAGEARCRPEPPQWTNRIHVDDCAGVLAYLLTLARPAAVYLASDSAPAPRCQVLDWLAGQLGVAPAARESGRAGQGRRVANARLLATGYRLRYPDYRAGYRSVLP